MNTKNLQYSNIVIFVKTNNPSPSTIKADQGQVTGKDEDESGTFYTKQMNYRSNFTKSVR